MVYIFDTSSFSVLKSYFPGIFATLWAQVERLIDEGRIVSVREVLNELERRDGGIMHEWARAHRSLFAIPSIEEQEFVARIFDVAHFRTLIERRSLLNGTPCADPFVIAAAAVKGATVVTEERLKPNAAKIPNVCEHFNIPCASLAEFMAAEGWTF